MKPLCPKCLCTHWEDQACKVKSLAELPAIFPSPPTEFIPATEIDDSFSAPVIPEFIAEPVVFPMNDLVKPKKVLSKAHLAALKAGREAKARVK